MELNVKISYHDLWKLILQLPKEQLTRLKADLNTQRNPPKARKSPSEFQQFLLQGPTMDDDQYETFLENREYFNRWRTN